MKKLLLVIVCCLIPMPVKQTIKVKIKKVVPLVFALLFLCPFLSYADESCESCTSPCTIIRPSDDGCNTCSEVVYCKDGQWYSLGISSCTLAHCIKPIMIPNPFEDKK